MEIEDESTSITTWRIENYRYSWHEVKFALESPQFRISAHSGVWNFRLYPRGSTETSTDFIGIYLERAGFKPDFLTADCKISILDSNGEPKYTREAKNHVFPKGKTGGFAEFVRRQDVTGTDESIFLPGGTLTVQCCISLKENEMNEPIHNLVKSTIVIKREFLVWKIREFNWLSPPNQGIVDRKTGDDFDLSLNLISDSISVIFEIPGGTKLFRSAMDIETEMFRFIMGIYDSSGSVSLMPIDEYMFHSENPKVETFLVSRSNLLNNEKGYLNKGRLKLYCEIHYSTNISKGHVVWHSCDKMLEPCMFNIKNDSEESPSAAHPRCCHNNDSLRNGLQNLYQEGTLGDFSIEVQGETLRAHKAVLCARSPFFKGMLTIGMIEAQRNNLEIVCYSVDTVRRMLTFMYTDKADDLDWQTAKNLYCAAHFFQMTVLKSVCAEFLKTNLTADNVKKIERHAGAYEDADLKRATSVYLERLKGESNKSLRRLPTRFVTPSLQTVPKS